MSIRAAVISRRQLLSGIWKPPVAPVRKVGGDDAISQVAVIQGRLCLAYRNLFCSTCVERCPVEGAIEVREGVPQVVASMCTGCGDCQAVCPAPGNAVRMIASPSRKENQ
jgi:Na+-translocating ferredoxin:NAD+ oxidoreductase RNF subunit RnfB